MAQQARYFWLLAGCALSSACAGSGPASPASAAAPAQKARAQLNARAALRTPTGAEGPRLFPPLDGGASLPAGEERDGSRRAVAYGLRVLLRPSGALELGREYLPVARRARSLELPARLGGGFVFYVPSSNTTLFYRAQTFTGELEAFARLDFEADQVIAGFDRLLVVASHPDRIVALDVEQGTALGMGSLPPSPAYGKMAFVDGWFGAIQVPLRGTLVTFDAGASWRPLGFSTTSIDVRDGALRLVGPDGALDLDQFGTLTRRDQTAPPVVRENAVAQALRAPATSGASRDRLGHDALKLAVLRGFRDGDGSFVVADAGMLLRVRASDGKLLDSDEHAYPGSGECNALQMGDGYGFACNDNGPLTTLYAFRPPLGMQRVRSFTGARYVSASGNGALVVRGPCSGAEATAPGAYCVASRSGEFREIQVRGDLGVERVVALADGRVAVIVPPRLGANGFLSLIDTRGREQRLPLKLPSSGPSTALLEKGLWLDGFVEQTSGVLSGWVAAADPFAGVRVALDATVSVSHPESSIDRALLSGTRALVVGRTGRTHESIDGGFEWTDVELPSEFDAGRELQGDARLQGCSALGCAFGGFVRVGWRSTSAAPRLPVAALPDVTPLVQPGGSRWLLHCEATGEASEPALPGPRQTVGPHDDGTTAPWAAFLELPPPPLKAGEVGFDVVNSGADSTPFHAYAWGERGADWARAGHLQLRVPDRFQVRGGALQSAPTRSPWPDVTGASEAFGFDGSGNPSAWRAVLEQGGRAAAVLVTARGVSDLLLFEEGKTVTRIANANRAGGGGFGLLSTVAKLNDAWYAGSFNESHAFTLSKIVGGRVDRLAEYPDLARDISTATLVRGVHGEELGVWVSGASWFLYPIDPTTHALLAPLYKTPADLAEMPAPCAADADGYLLSGSPSLEPSLAFARAGEQLYARRVEAQFVWSARGLCTRGFAADTETPIHAPSSDARLVAQSTRSAVPLTVTERQPLGRRWGYLCAP